MSKNAKSLGALLAARKSLEAQLAAMPREELIAEASVILDRPELKAAAEDLAPIVAALTPDDKDRRLLASVIRILVSGSRMVGRPIPDAAAE